MKCRILKHDATILSDGFPVNNSGFLVPLFEEWIIDHLQSTLVPLDLAYDLFRNGFSIPSQPRIIYRAWPSPHNTLVLLECSPGKGLNWHCGIQLVSRHICRIAFNSHASTWCQSSPIKYFSFLVHCHVDHWTVLPSHRANLSLST